MELHRFFIAIARAAVNEDGCAGVALHPIVWSSGGLVKRCKIRVSAWEFAWVPGPIGLWRHGSVGWPCIEVSGADVGFCVKTTPQKTRFRDVKYARIWDTD